MPTREHWRLDGYDLKGTTDDESETTVRVHAVGGASSKRKALARHVVPHGSETLQVGAKPLANRQLVFAIRRPGNGDHYGVLAEIIDFLDDNDILYLHAPTKGATAYKDERLVWIVPESWEEPAPDGRGRLELRVNATILGVPEAYGGTARRPYTGSVEKTAGGYSVNGGADQAGPYLELPEQRSGWPKAIRKSDNTLVAVTTTVGSKRKEYQPHADGGGIRYWTTYDLTGFLHPAPSATGDVGLYQLYSNPLQDWFEWTSPDTNVQGIASQSVASFSVGTA